MLESNLTPENLDIIRASLPAIREKGVAIVSTMYKNMFEAYPNIKSYFNQANQSFGEDKTRGSQIEAFTNQSFATNPKVGSQAVSLTQAIFSYAENIGKPIDIGPAVLHIAHKHASLHILPEHYPIVGKYLIEAMRDILGSEIATDQVLNAWSQGYNFLANILIMYEDKLRADSVAKVGGWEGFRKFVVDKKVKESEEVTSFYLKPEDGGPIPPYEAGQFTCFRLDIPGEGLCYRSYTLSTSSGKGHFRVSIKREVGVRRYPNGVSSNYFHDHINVGDVLDIAPPYGELTLVDTNRPLVFIAGGIGVTAMFSMAQSAVEAKTPQDIYFIQCMRNRRLHPLAREVRKLARSSPRTKLHTFYSQPEPTDLYGEDYDTEGHLTLKELKELVPTPECEFYFTGPVKLMRDIRIGLRDWGVPPERIHYQCFGPMAVEIEAD